jgi:hypothetical protein
VDSIYSTRKHIAMDRNSIFTSLNKALFGEGKAGLVGRTSFPTIWCSSVATVSASPIKEVPMSSRSSLRTYISFSTCTVPCNILLLFNNPAQLINFEIGKFSSSSVGAPECGAFAWCASQSWSSHPSSPISNLWTTPTSSNCLVYFYC